MRMDVINLCLCASCAVLECCTDYTGDNSPLNRPFGRFRIVISEASVICVHTAFNPKALRWRIMSKLVDMLGLSLL